MPEFKPGARPEPRAESLQLKTESEIAGMELAAKRNYLRSHIAEYGASSLPGTLALDMVWEKGSGYATTVLNNFTKFKDLSVTDFYEARS